jgi:sulfur-oxidizing protein SoxX
MGKKLANDRQKGNCVACHSFQGAVLAGTIAPPLVGMQKRYPDKGKLRAQIYDATAINPHSAMPPFGKYKVLTDEELDAITDWVYTL